MYGVTASCLYFTYPQVSSLMAINDRKLVPKFLTQSRFSPVPQVDLTASCFHCKHISRCLQIAEIWEELPTMYTSVQHVVCTQGLRALLGVLLASCWSSCWYVRGLVGARLVPCLYPKGYLAQSVTSDLQARPGPAGWLASRTEGRCASEFTAMNW